MVMVLSAEQVDVCRAGCCRSCGAFELAKADFDVLTEGTLERRDQFGGLDKASLMRGLICCRFSVLILIYQARAKRF